MYKTLLSTVIVVHVLHMYIYYSIRYLYSLHDIFIFLILFQFGNNCLHCYCETGYCNPDLISLYLSKGVLDINATNHVSDNIVLLYY